MASQKTLEIILRHHMKWSILLKERSGTFTKLMTLDQRAWCAPISIKLSQDEKNAQIMKVLKSSPVDKGTTCSLYLKKSGNLETRIISTSQDKTYNLQVSFKI